MHTLTENVPRLAQKVDDLSAAVEKQEQYSGCNCFLLHGVSEQKKYWQAAHQSHKWTSRFSY